MLKLKGHQSIICIFLYMKFLVLIAYSFATVSMFLSCKEQKGKVSKSDVTTSELLSSDTSEAGIAENEAFLVPTYTYDELAPLLQKDDDTLRVVNFWATWCKPCVAELPYFQKATETFKDRQVKIILVSLDFPKNINTRLVSFIKKNKIKNEVWVLDDPDADTWINKVDTSWSGAIPATVLYKQGQKQFYEQSFTYEELERTISAMISG